MVTEKLVKCWKSIWQQLLRYRVIFIHWKQFWKVRGVMNNEKHDCRDYPLSLLGAGADLTARIPPHLSLLYNFTATAAKWEKQETVNKPPICSSCKRERLSEVTFWTTSDHTASLRRSFQATHPDLKSIVYDVWSSSSFSEGERAQPGTWGGWWCEERCRIQLSVRR